jgi:hypothetical protein
MNERHQIEMAISLKMVEYDYDGAYAPPRI